MQFKARTRPVNTFDPFKTDSPRYPKLDTLVPKPRLWKRDRLRIQNGWTAKARTIPKAL